MVYILWKIGKCLNWCECEGVGDLWAGNDVHAFPHCLASSDWFALRCCWLVKDASGGCAGCADGQHPSSVFDEGLKG